MKAFFTGSEWKDTTILDVLIAGLRDTSVLPKDPLIIIGDRSEAGGLALSMAQSRYRVQTADVVGKLIPRSVRNSQLMVVCSDDLTKDKVGLSRLDLALRLEVPVYHLRHMNLAEARKIHRWRQRRGLE